LPKGFRCHDGLVLRGGLRRVIVTAMVAAVIAEAGGCGTTQEGAAEQAAQAFYGALDAQDGAAACDLLAVRTRSEVEKSAQKPCAQAILDEEIPAVDGSEKVNAFGVAAQVRYTGETAFLSRFRDGWHVVAAGCRRQPDGLYDCQVAAG
jgi:hypothetical protein